MTDHTNLIARLRDGMTGNMFADRLAAADALEYQAKLIEQFGGIGKDAMEQCFALTKERDQLRAEVAALKTRIVDSGVELQVLAAGAAPTADRDYKKLYEELLYCVGSKYQGETRHETAKRYLIDREKFSIGAAPTKEQT